MTFNLLQKRARSDQRGLTLLELLVVLSILAVLSTVALTSSSGIADQARYEATQRTLENIREAVLGPANLRDTDGTLLISGFLADVGRLPEATANMDNTGFTLEELWNNVNGLNPHQVRQATGATNLEPGSTSESDEDVYVATGWRGPYLRLPPGNTTLYDGWGAEIASPSGIGGGLLFQTNGTVVTGAGQEIGQVWSFGANGTKPIPLDPPDIGYDRDMPVTFVAPSPLTDLKTVQLTVRVELQKADGSPPDMPVPADEIIVRLFAPDPDTGLIAVTRLDDPFSANSLMFDFTTTPGARVVRAYYDTSNDGSIQSSSAVTHLNLRHGGNTRTIILTVP
jgi:prepilin-type N-terminal cleavage/methylation domain-containing protein